MPTNPIEDIENCDVTATAAAQPLPTGVTPGAAVLVRGVRWRVDAVLAHADCHEVHLWGGSPPVRRVLLWPFDRPVAAETSPRYESVPLSTWASRVAAAIRDQTDPLTPRPGTATVRILPYQLAPAVAMAGGAARLLLADEVGLGKTIQAGWLVADLLAREPGARMLLAVPAGLRRQWSAELATGFGVAVIAVDARWLRAAVGDLPADVSPWATPGVYLGSVDFLKRGDVAASLETQVWDLLVVDEAHTATSPNERHAALAAIAGRARRVVTITATPYSGDTAGFASMTALGAVAGDTPPRMFRRSREDVGDPRRRRHRFSSVRISRAETRLQRLLERYSRLVWRDAPGDVECARLAVTILRKRALSSAAAAAQSLRRRLALLLVGPLTTAPRQLSLFDDETDGGDEPPDAALAARGLADLAAEQRWLASLIDAADEAAGMDSKERYLWRLLARVGSEPVIVFTEYRDTLLQLAAALPPSMQLHGGLTAAERTAVQARFNEAGGLLLATDAAAEGLNLQRRCRILVNYELPWNPARLEQRIGRIDRIGQARAVHAITLVARDTAEDLVIASLARRLARVVASLGEQDRLGAFLTDAMTARLVIAGGARADAAAVELPALVSREPAVAAEAGAAAARLLLRRTGRRDTAGAAATVAVSMVPARGISPGFVVALRGMARTHQGDVIGARAVLIHVACNTARPSSRVSARSSAARAVTAAAGVAGDLPDVRAWFAALNQVHRASLDRRQAREQALRDRGTATTAVQPGLFDRRAIRAAETLSDAALQIRAEHDSRIAALERSRALRLVFTPLAVLIAWR